MLQSCFASFICFFWVHSFLTVMTGKSIKMYFQNWHLKSYGCLRLEVFLEAGSAESLLTESMLQVWKHPLPCLDLTPCAWIRLEEDRNGSIRRFSFHGASLLWPLVTSAVLWKRPKEGLRKWKEKTLWKHCFRELIVVVPILTLICNIWMLTCILKMHFNVVFFLSSKMLSICSDTVKFCCVN